MKRFNELFGWFGYFFCLPFGKSTLEAITPITKQLWFHFGISHASADVQLSGKPANTFLVRLTLSNTQTEPFTICKMRPDGSVAHDRIKQEQDLTDLTCPRTRLCFSHNGQNIYASGLVSLVETLCEQNILGTSCSHTANIYSGST